MNPIFPSSFKCFGRLLLLTPNHQLLIIAGRRCQGTARKRDENEKWFWLNSIYEREQDDVIKRPTVIRT